MNCSGVMSNTIKKGNINMEVRFNTNLNKIFEIIGLLYSSNHPETLEKEQMLKAASEFGINGEELYRKINNIEKKYIKAFQKELVLSKEDTSFFEDTSHEFILILQIVFADNPHWLDNIDSIPADEIFMTFIHAIVEFDSKIDKKPTLNEIITLLKDTGLEPDMCWKMILFLQDPKKQVEHLAYIINQNIPAYEQAILSVEKPLQRLIQDFPKFQYKASTIFKDEIRKIEITPTLIYPYLEVISTQNNSYIGLFIKDIYQMMGNHKISRSNLIPVLKVLSDNSKFDILLSVKNAPKYNMELAEQLGLTAATISHHMNVLLTHGLVSVEKHEGRVYYTLVKETIEEIIDELKYTFSI